MIYNPKKKSAEADFLFIHLHHHLVRVALGLLPMIYTQALQRGERQCISRRIAGILLLASQQMDQKDCGGVMVNKQILPLSNTKYFSFWHKYCILYVYYQNAEKIHHITTSVGDY